MPFPGQLGSVAAAGGGTPLNYSNLVAFWESETSVADTGGEVDTWTDQKSSIVLSQLGVQPGPELESNTQNGFDGISFEETTAPDPINRKIGSSAGALDDFFFGSGTKAISFAARWDRTADFTFNLPSTIASKRYSFGLDEGWVLRLSPDGTILFRHYMSNGAFWLLEASGFFSVDDLVLGSIRYDGGNTSNSGTFRLWNGSSFVETGTVTTASGSSTKASDAAGDFVVGNIYDPLDLTDNSPYQGPVFAVWMTSPFQISLDDQYLQRYVP